MKKGFTLIELLAVILILGIIALIAVPQVTNVIENATKGSVEASAKHYLDAVTNAIGINKLDQDPSNDLTDGVKNVADLADVKVTGEAPTSGQVLIENGVVKTATFVVNGYTVDCNDKGKCEATKGKFYYSIPSKGSINVNSQSSYKKLRPFEYNTYIKAVIENDAVKEYYICIYDDVELCELEKDFAIISEEIKNHFEYDSSWTTLPEEQRPASDAGTTYKNRLYKDSTAQQYCDITSAKTKCGTRSIYMNAYILDGIFYIYTGDEDNSVHCGYKANGIDLPSCWY